MSAERYMQSSITMLGRDLQVNTIFESRWLIINNILVRVILLIILSFELAAISLIAHYVYNGVIDVGFYFAIITSVMIYSIYIWKKANTRNVVVRSIAVQMIIAIILPVIFCLFRPEYTFSQAKTLVAQKSAYLNGFTVGDKQYDNITLSNSPNFFVKKAYLISISKDNGVERYIIFNPLNGDYKYLE